MRRVRSLVLSLTCLLASGAAGVPSETDSQTPAAESHAPLHPVPLWKLPIREVCYVGNTLIHSAIRPSLYDIASGLVAKSPGLLAGVEITLGSFSEVDAPVLLATNLAMQGGLTLFHGPGVATFNELIKRMRQERGDRYIDCFFFVYGQSIAFSFISISMAAGLGKDVPTLGPYIASVALAIMGAPIGSQAYKALEQLEQSGWLPKSLRNAYQVWVRDNLFTASSAAFNTGQIKTWALLFGIDLASIVATKFLAHQLGTRKGKNVTSCSDAFDSDAQPPPTHPERSGDI